MFVLAQTGGTTAYSPEVRLELKASPLLTPVDCAGGYLGTEYTEDSTVLSNVFACPDGSKRFFQIADGQLKLHAIDPADVARARSRAFPFPPSWTTVLRFASCRYRTRPRSCSCLQREAKARDTGSISSAEPLSRPIPSTKPLPSRLQAAGPPY